MWKRAWLLLSGCAVLLIAASCATPYKSYGLAGGYSDRRINDSAYFVAFSGNGYASKEHVWNMWMYRCAELTLEKGYAYFFIKPGDPPATVSRAAGGLLPAVYHPRHPLRDALARLHSAPARLHKTYYTYYSTTITTWNSRGTVLMFHQPLPAEMLWALDAQTVINDLAAYVQNNGSAPAPTREQIYDHAFVAHARFDYGDDTLRVIPAPEAGASATAPRSPAAIRSIIGAARVGFLAAFREHQRSDPAGGSVTIGFTVNSGGIVTDSHVVSSTM
ncbi:MAG TPA: hypothetical protein VHE37_10380, partial [Nevskiaceae bacterium]|nr:hypothetical protein [Nevskiaceae bacterium]